MRQITLDTETTGLSPQAGHRIIEIGAVELINRRPTGNVFHCYLQPDREVDFGAMKVHGISNEFLIDKPRFHEVVSDFKEFIQGAELIIHNAPFDIGFINYELSLLKDPWADISALFSIIDTLPLARKKHPGQKNNLDALCKRYQVDNAGRTLHGALLDAQILAEVYLAMTGGQASLSLQEEQRSDMASTTHRVATAVAVTVQHANADELQAHQDRLKSIEKACGKPSLWESMENL
ncbi:MAG: DNA polymerase III subunit epsilon [Gammaproteobacteria bacterium]